jgi:hypothetical protein
LRQCAAGFFKEVAGPLLLFFLHQSEQNGGWTVNVTARFGSQQGASGVRYQEENL